MGIGASIGFFPIPEKRESIDFHVPDFFAPEHETFPSYLSTFEAFNNKAVAKSGRIVRKGLPLADGLRLLSQYPRLGIRPSTLLAAAWQLAAERRLPRQQTHGPEASDLQIQAPEAGRQPE